MKEKNKMEMGIYLRADTELEAIKEALAQLQDPVSWTIEDISNLDSPQEWEIWLGKKK